MARVGRAVTSNRLRTGFRVRSAMKELSQWRVPSSRCPSVGQSDSLLRFCWQPFEAACADEHAAAVYLRSQGYGVDLVDLRQ
jgi:hypothetical protein